MWDDEKILITREYTKLATIKNLYDVADRLRENATTLLHGGIVEVDDVILGNGILVTNNQNTMNSLVVIPQAEITPYKPPCYVIPDKFYSFDSIVTHYYNEVKPREHSKDRLWRKYLSSSKKKISTSY